MITQRKVLKTLCIVTVALAMVGTVGCAKKKKGVPIDQTYVAPTDSMAGGEGTGQPTIDLNSLLWNESTGLQKVYFDYDSSALRPDSMATLNTNADKIKQAGTNVYIQIEGHCDERGTQEYNMALGERRALAVRDYLIRLGVPAGQLITISYGEEDPQADGHDEASWALNRRAEFNEGTPR